MKTCTDYLDELHRLHGWSDYRIGKELGISKQAISGYRTGKTFFSDEVAYKVADALGVDPLEVWIDVQIQRHPGTRMTDHLKKKRQVIVAKVASWAAVAAAALPALVERTSVYIMLSRPGVLPRADSPA